MSQPAPLMPRSVRKEGTAAADSGWNLITAAGLARKPARAMLVMSALFLGAAGLMLAAPNGAGDEIPLTVGRSVVLDHPDEISRIAITDPAVADAVPISTREVLINAKAAGVTSLILWSRSGERNFFTVSVTANTEQIQEHLLVAFPGEDIHVTASRGVVTLDGKVTAPEIVDRAVAMVNSAGRGDCGQQPGAASAASGTADPAQGPLRGSATKRHGRVWSQHPEHRRRQHAWRNNHGSV